MLCNRIEENVGQDVFKSEQYLRDVQLGRIENKTKQQMNKAHTKSTGGFISGEVKLALTLHLLASGSYLDLSLLLEVGFSYLYEVFHNVISCWINNDQLVKINGEDYLNDNDRMAEVAADFSRGSNGLIVGAIGALDGCLVKICKPTKRDKVT